MKGRRPKLDRPVHKRTHIPESVLNEVEILLADPLTGRPRHGAFSALVTMLLKQWLTTQRITPFPTEDEVEELSQ